MAFYPIVVVQLELASYQQEYRGSMGMSGTRANSWLWISLGNNSVYDTEIGSTRGLIVLVGRGLSDWLFEG